MTSEDKPYLIDPVDPRIGMIAQWRDEIGQQLNVFEHDTERFPLLPAFHAIWSAERGFGQKDFSDREEALSFSVKKAEELGLPAGDNFVESTEIEEAAEKESARRYIRAVVAKSQAEKVARPAIAAKAEFPGEGRWMGPWLRIDTKPKAVHGRCVLCKEIVTQQHSFFSHTGFGVSLHVVCGDAFQKAHPNAGLDLNWAPNGVPEKYQIKTGN